MLLNNIDRFKFSESTIANIHDKKKIVCQLLYCLFCCNDFIVRLDKMNFVLIIIHFRCQDCVIYPSLNCALPMLLREFDQMKKKLKSMHAIKE